MIQSHFNQLFTELLANEKPEKIAVAVSGGADSVALLHLASDWARTHAAELVVFTVDHHLRPESKEELCYVRELADSLGHEFYAMSWDCGGTKVALQERAREGRYDLMSTQCHELGVDILLTAHHFDDLIETYLMRKRKKSGVLGLSSSSSFFYKNIMVLRPLVDFRKSQLIAYLNALGIKWFEDESNSSDAYERNRVRRTISEFSEEDREGIVEEIQQVNDEAEILNAKFIAALAECAWINNYGFAVIDLEKLRREPEDIIIQILNYVLTIISGKAHLPRFRSVHPIVQQVVSGAKIDCSLHSCILRGDQGNLLIFKEKSTVTDVAANLEKEHLWDSRFQIILPQNLDSGYHCARLEFDDYLEIKDKLNFQELAKISDNNHKTILFTLPVIKNLEKIVAIPHISYYDGLEHKIKIIFRPNFISRFTHFL